jgi:hypothetical protein
MSGPENFSRAWLQMWDERSVIRSFASVVLLLFRLSRNSAYSTGMAKTAPGQAHSGPSTTGRSTSHGCPVPVAWSICHHPHNRERLFIAFPCRLSLRCPAVKQAPPHNAASPESVSAEPIRGAFAVLSLFQGRCSLLFKMVSRMLRWRSRFACWRQ